MGKKKKKIYDRLGRTLELGDQFIYSTGGKDGKPFLGLDDLSLNSITLPTTITIFLRLVVLHLQG